MCICVWERTRERERDTVIVQDLERVRFLSDGACGGACFVVQIVLCLQPSSVLQFLFSSARVVVAHRRCIVCRLVHLRCIWLWSCTSFRLT